MRSFVELAVRRRVAVLMIATALLGASFVGMQAFEWSKLISEGVRPWGNPFGAPQFGSAFFMITGFHGLHVTIGAIMLTTIFFRVLKGHFTPENHFAFEAVAWYWHFVDVVWIGLYVFVYWL